MTPPLFTALSARRMSGLIRAARQRVCYAAPGLHEETAAALAALKSTSSSIPITVSLDFDERTLRYAYLEAVEWAEQVRPMLKL